jgi:hypothetical protein
MRVSETKSSDHPWLIVSGNVIGARVLNARLRAATSAHHQLLFAVQLVELFLVHPPTITR